MVYAATEPAYTVRSVPAETDAGRCLLQVSDGPIWQLVAPGEQDTRDLGRFPPCRELAQTRSLAVSQSTSQQPGGQSD
jgi:hypothetical protein